MPRIFISAANVPPMPTRIRNGKDARQVLDRMVMCIERAEYNEHKATNASASTTGDRLRVTAYRWQAKADQALEVLQDWISQQE